MAKKEKIVILEGLPASGKTTIADTLRDVHGYNKTNESLGRFDPTKANNSQRVVFQATLERYRISRKLGGLVVMDRGYPSMLAWDYCAQQLGWAQDLEEKRRWVDEALMTNDLFEPDLYVYLRSRPDVSLDRRPREPSHDVWSTRRGMDYYTEYCDNFFCRAAISPITIQLDATRAVSCIVAEIRREVEI